MVDLSMAISVSHNQMLSPMKYLYIYLVGGIPTPLKNDGVHQLGLLFPMYGKIKVMFQTTNQIYMYIYISLKYVV